MGIPIRGFFHDWSKLRPSEWFSYANYFGGFNRFREKGRYHEPGVSESFDRAWLGHIHKNPHHWQYWVLINGNDKETKCLPMPEKCIREMICDWRGAGRAQGKPDTLEWYRKHRDKINLHPDTRERVEELLGYEGD
jgi:hypothetical protein